MNKHIFAWDLGATKCTAGVIEYTDHRELVCKKHCTIKLTDATSLENLIQQIESQLGFSMVAADAICIGGAGLYDGESLLLENPYPFPMSIGKIAKQQNWPAYAVVHDYAPIVCATFTSYLDQPDNVKRLNTCPIQAHGRRVALGIGTGLGLKDGVLLPNGDFWLGQNEIGHIGVPTPPLAEREHLEVHQDLLRFLKEKGFLASNQPLTFEKILSGQGTVRLYQFFYGEDVSITPEEVGDKMREGGAREMFETFAWYAGLFVGTVQLSFMPAGGVWITGGVALKNLEIFDSPNFFAGINASPAYRPQREAYPLGVMCNHEHALIGCGYYATRRLMKNA